jgi:Zn-dependent protease with chaperone function
MARINFPRQAFKIKRRWRIMVKMRRLPALAVLLVLAGCAGQVRPPQTKGGNASPAQTEFVLRERLRVSRRIFRIGERLLFLGVPLCGSQQVRSIGIALWNMHSGGKFGPPIMASAFGLDDELRIQALGERSPAARAGLRQDDRIAKIGGQPAARGKDAVKLAGTRLRALNRTGQPYTIAVRRGGRLRQVTVQPAPRCAYSYGLVFTSQINAFADGKRVVVTTGLMRFAHSDAELAVVFGHELAHNTLKHLRSTRATSIVGSIGGIAADIALGVIGIPTFGIFSRLGGLAGRRAFSVQFEKEADYVGLYFAALAGYPLQGAPDIWRRLAVENPRKGNRGLARTHPSYAERLTAMEATIQEIRRKRKAGLPIRPNRGDPSGADDSSGGDPR